MEDELNGEEKASEDLYFEEIEYFRKYYGVILKILLGIFGAEIIEQLQHIILKDKLS